MIKAAMFICLLTENGHPEPFVTYPRGGERNRRFIGISDVIAVDENIVPNLRVDMAPQKTLITAVGHISPPVDQLR